MPELFGNYIIIVIYDALLLSVTIFPYPIGGRDCVQPMSERLLVLYVKQTPVEQSPP